ncbi:MULTISPECIES: hypothetical protein [unclassified Candidatus Accumulibacter]|uniref:hypothetical protein n=1 Tax=unclassified Candidatus Accumulibacter TaxID=2619054 RepID=UPI0025C1F007|nr:MULTISPECIES: hypothetical protein [unclassified Candidatus Accumulibacter]
MNELYAADPLSCENSGDLRYLLSQFGPFTGRYLAAYPVSWRGEIRERCETLGPIEAERVKVLLRRARERAALLCKAALPWDDRNNWLENYRSVLRQHPREFASGIVPRPFQARDVIMIDDLDLSPTADESIEAIPKEYLRVSKTLLLLSPELVFVDPYLNPCKSDRQDVLVEMFRLAGRGKCRGITCWARDSEIVGDRRYSWDEVRAAIEKILTAAEWPGDREFRYLLVDDATCRSKMHARYLVSIKGGIRYDQGFQRLPKGRRNDVSPLGSVLHDHVLKTYHEGEHDMEIVRAFERTVREPLKNERCSLGDAAKTRGKSAGART